MIRIATILLLSLIIACSPQVNHVAGITPDYYRIDKRQEAEDKEIAELIQPYKVKLDETMNRVIGSVEKSMTKSKPNSPLNNWVADVILDQANVHVGNVDFAVQNYGGIRVPAISAGTITVRNIYELMPFDNLVTVITADAEIVQMLFDRIAEYGGWPLSRNSSFTISNGKAIDVIINGEPINMQSTYTFALPDYIANGGDSCFFLEKGKRQDLKLLIRDAMLNHIESNDKLIKYIDDIRINVE